MQTIFNKKLHTKWYWRALTITFFLSSVIFSLYLGRGNYVTSFENLIFQKQKQIATSQELISQTASPYEKLREKSIISNIEVDARYKRNMRNVSLLTSFIKIILYLGLSVILYIIITRITVYIAFGK